MSLNRRCCCLPECPPAAELTLMGVDASAPCVDRALGLGLACTAPYSCVTGVSSAVDGVYRVPRWRGPTSDGWCEFRGEFDAETTFLQRTATSVFLGVPTCTGTGTTRSGTRVRVFIRVNRGLVREVWVWSIDNGVAAVPVCFFNGYLHTTNYGDSGAFDGCAAATCARLMSGGSFMVRRSF